MDRTMRLVLLLMLLAPLAGFQANQSAPAAAWQSKVDPWVLNTAARGPTEFLVFLREQADLGAAQKLPTKLEKGAYVYNQLTQTARRTQGPILALLQDLSRRSPGKVEYRAYWVANLIWVRAGSDLVQTLALRDDVAHLYANPQVRLEEPVWEGSPLTPSQPSGIEWNIQKVEAPEVWAQGFTGQGVVIGGQDTGYDWTHPALKAKYRGWNGTEADHNYNWFDAISSSGSSCGANSPVPCDDYGHGTHTMGIMVGDDGQGNQIGMAPGARWIGCRNMNYGVGTPQTYTDCFQWFIAPTDLSGLNPRPDLAPDVINNSWSCPASEGCDANSLKTIVENVRAAGIVTVQSAGNKGFSCGSLNEPAGTYDASFTVGATDLNDYIAGFSSRGPSVINGVNLLKPDISAPGVSVRSSVPGNSYSMMSGTSMSGPHVAGLVALLISAHPALAGQVDQIEQIIEQNAVPRTTSQTCGGVAGSQIPNNTYGWGRIDAWAAIQSLERKLKISLQPSNLTYDPGQVITYTLQVSYTFPYDGTPTSHIMITDVIPAETSFITATLPITLTGNTVVWPIPSLSPGQSQTVDLVVRVSDTASATIYNQFYFASSDDIATVSGPPVPIFRAHHYFLPMIQK